MQVAFRKPVLHAQMPLGNMQIAFRKPLLGPQMPFKT